MTLRTIMSRVTPARFVDSLRGARPEGSTMATRAIVDRVTPTRFMDSICGATRYCSQITEGVRSKKLKIDENRNVEDHRRRVLAARYEMRRKLYKALCRDPSLPSDMRDAYRCKLSRLPRNSSFTRIRNRCIFTGRSRGVYSQFRMSRIVFRELASNGELLGITKASW
uniref:Small ribosomal subunit protein uS14m n=1 Tax=Monsonia emarginata TaxID=28966 RepID=A0A0G2YL04_9ROSI|nr:ribosomal protein S14 [Monsonia emarginata]